MPFTVMKGHNKILLADSTEQVILTTGNGLPVLCWVILDKSNTSMCFFLKASLSVLVGTDDGRIG